MKVALVPIAYEIYNYGGVLQFLALQKVLLNMGHECEILKCKDDTVLCKRPTSWWKTLAWRILNPFFSIQSKKNNNILSSVLYNRRVRVDEYRKRNFVKIVDLDDIDINTYNAVICGSDQIWNPARARKRAFLTFVPDNIRKIIYAASMGCEEMTDYQKKCFKPVIERLDYISVREKSAKEILDTFVEHKDISVQLDPTLLLTKKDWELVVNYDFENNPSGKKYILCYFLGAYSDKKEYLLEFARQKSLIVVNVPYASGESIDSEEFGDLSYIDATPDEFLGLIKNAEYVFTDSFHACVFSIIFNRQFYVYKRDGRSQMMGRIYTLLDYYNIENRIVDDQNDIFITERINYDGLDKKIEQKRLESMNFLRNAIESK